jgi:hypothetical protein
MNHRFIYLFLIIFTFISCEKDAIDLETFGSIEGLVLNSETEQPLANANITTTPPTNSILTTQNGTFILSEIPTGSYSIKVTKSGFQNNSVSVTVREENTAIANITLTPEVEEEEDTSDEEDDDGGSDDGNDDSN